MGRREFFKAVQTRGRSGLGEMNNRKVKGSRERRKGFGAVYSMAYVVKDDEIRV